ncbi:hypothetical protein GKQ77_27800 [Streptomyces sp. BG9H]|uniref:Alpha-amylase n=1 Tax=Streptomyces anatolicus TaxID=2675858 RepID=A0ABS6YV75_9ACTN|nr:hypothetical protein [Streptomyces anatolicus]MBW5425320.1 hypothetical protein [Streptomyces anatolicus]
MKNTVKMASTAAAALALAFTAQGAASATTSGATDTAPSCVTWENPFPFMTSWGKLHLTNGCTYSVNVKGILPKTARQTDCVALAPGEKKTVMYFTMGNELISRIETC